MEQMDMLKKLIDDDVIKFIEQNKKEYDEQYRMFISAFDNTVMTGNIK